MRLKKVIVMLLLIAFMMPQSIFAAEYPQEIWAPLDSYTAALNGGDDAKIYEYGMQIINIMEGQPDSQLKTDFLAGKYEQVSKCAERLGLYNEAITLYEKYLPYGEIMGWTDGVKYAQNKLYLLRSFLDLYIEDASYTPPYYGAKFEPERGVLFGSVYDADPRIMDFDNELIKQYFPKQNSSWLMYLEFGENPRELGRYDRYLSRAEELGVTVEFAWNTYDSLANLDSYKSYITDVIDYLGSYNVPIFLRFGAEMNVGPNGTDPTAYVNAFRFVAEYAKTKSNIAVVWSPSDISALDRSYASYYPGDEYVDWIGMSLYVAKYFEGTKDHGDQTDPINTYFVTDEYANPLMRVVDLMQFIESNNIQKPVMISECGVSHYVRTENEDLTEWAKIQLSKMYSELLMRYPRIKLINYFNVQRENETNAYELFTSDPIYQLYNTLVENPYFLSSKDAKAPYAYRLFEGGEVGESFSVTAVGYYPKTLYNTVKFYLDGTLAGELGGAPYTMRFSGVAPGAHTIKVELCDAGQVKLTREYNITVEQDVTVKVDGQTVEFPDQKPFITEGRTMIPVRGLLENMGMRVEWDDATQTVTIYNGDSVITLQIGSNTLYKDGVPTQMDVPAQTYNGRTMIPLRFVVEAAGATVDWNDQTFTAEIYSAG